MINKKIKLTLLSLVAIAFIFSVPFNNEWLNTKIFNDHFSISDQAEHLGVEERMEYRFGNSYLAYQAIIKTIAANANPKDVVLLLPPASYIREQKVEGGFDSPEPAVFYYFTAIKGVIWKSPEVEKANWAFVADNHRMYLRKINNKEELNSYLQIYKKYD
jgi:hypothetical protein